MKSIKEYFNRDSIHGKMGSIIEYAKANRKRTFAVIAAVIMIISGSFYIINTLNHSNNSVNIDLNVSLTGSIPNMSANTSVKVGGMDPFTLSKTSASSFASNFILDPSNATFLISAVNSSLAMFNTQYVAQNATDNSTLLSMINNQKEYIPINDRSMNIVFDHSLNNSWNYSIPFTDLYNNLSKGWREMHFDAIASLSIYGLYNFVFDDHVYAYYYYNAIDYNPYSRSNTLSIEPKFNLSKPFMVKPLQSASIAKIHPGRIIGSGGGGGKTCRSYSTVKTVYLDKMIIPFPLSMLTGDVSNGIPTISDSSTAILQSLSYQGASTIPFSDQYTTSDNPTWYSNNVNVNATGSNSTTSSSTLAMQLSISATSGPAMAYIPNVTATVTVTEYGYYVCEGSYYYYISEGSTVSYSIVNQNNNKLNIYTALLDNFWNKNFADGSYNNWTTNMSQFVNKLVSISTPASTQNLEPHAQQSKVDIYGNSSLKASNTGTGVDAISIVFGVASIGFAIGSAIVTGGLDLPLAALALISGLASVTIGVIGMLATPVYAVSSGIFLTQALLSTEATIGTTFTEYGSSAGEQLYLPTGSSPIVNSQTGLISISQ
jgi:hypothetical protein